MSEKNTTLFTIGQFASLHNINKKTLMWYDEINLFKPAEIKENGYRYYAHYQSSTLETILMLRELNVSLDEIKKYMDHKSVVSLSQLLDDKLKDLNQTILHLQTIKSAMKKQKKEVESLMNIDLDSMQIIEKDEQSYIMIQTNKNISLEKEIEMLIKETQKHKKNRLYHTHYGSIISVDHLRNRQFDQYEAIFLSLPNISSEHNIHISPKGKYLRTYCKGKWDLLPQKYEEIFEYASNHHLQLEGYAYETGINENIIDTMDDYITMIEIPIKS